MVILLRDKEKKGKRYTYPMYTHTRSTPSNPIPQRQGIDHSETTPRLSHLSIETKINQVNFSVSRQEKLDVVLCRM